MSAYCEPEGPTTVCAGDTLSMTLVISKIQCNCIQNNKWHMATTGTCFFDTTYNDNRERTLCNSNFSFDSETMHIWKVRHYNSRSSLYQCFRRSFRYRKTQMVRLTWSLSPTHYYLQL